jgi:hypothetical protein
LVQADFPAARPQGCAPDRAAAAGLSHCSIVSILRTI